MSCPSALWMNSKKSLRRGEIGDSASGSKRMIGRRTGWTPLFTFLVVADTPLIATSLN